MTTEDVGASRARKGKGSRERDGVERYTEWKDVESSRVREKKREGSRGSKGLGYADEEGGGVRTRERGSLVHIG